jgi:hypothetical protein
VTRTPLAAQKLDVGHETPVRVVLLESVVKVGGGCVTVQLEPSHDSASGQVPPGPR